MVSRRFAAGKRQYKRSRQNPIPVRCQGAGKKQAKKRALEGPRTMLLKGSALQRKKAEIGCQARRKGSTFAAVAASAWLPVVDAALLTASLRTWRRRSNES